MQAYHAKVDFGSELSVIASNLENLNVLAHWHREPELVYVVEGKITIGINKESRELVEGEYAIMGSRDIHYFESQYGNSRVWVIIFSPEMVGEYAEWPFQSGFTRPFLEKSFLQQLSYQTRTRMQNLCNEILGEMERKERGYELFVRSSILEFCATCLRYLETYDKSGETKSYRIHDFEKIQKAIEYLEENYSEDISLEEVSKYVSFSSYYFCNVFSKYTGIGFKDFLNRIRVNQAEKMIKTTDKSMLEISMECGFNSVRTFNRNFREIKGHVPSKVKTL